MKARISEKGYAILSNSKAAGSLVQAIIEHGDKIMAGESVDFDFASKDHPGIITKAKVHIVSSSPTPLTP
ncbi:MAG TPA: hypothetical protein VGO45_11070 [Bacteroidia bacterium]|jgi:hypothetical protein|nr:hypothetical protein [Bacteroidia bacterium]